MTLHRHLPVSALQDFFHIGHLRQAQFLRHLRPYLCRIAVNGLTTTQNHIGHAQFLNSSSQRITGGQCVGTCKSAVGQQIAPVGPTVQTLANHFGCTGRPHGDDGHGRTRIRIFQPQSLFQRIQVFRIEDGRQSRTVYRTFRCHGIRPDIPRVGNLLGKYNDV